MTKAEFEQGVRRNQDKLFRMAYLSLRSYADCQDAVQETLLRGWAARDSLRHAEYFDTWLTRILLNVINDFCRRAARRPTSELTNEIPADFAPPDPDLRDAIRALDGKLRAPLLLRYIAGYSGQRNRAAAAHNARAGALAAGTGQKAIARTTGR